ncbi:unnamed protein product [Boreogadus saida]
MDYERWLLEDELDFEFDGRGYRFEPEFTQEELREMEARATEAPEAPAEAVPSITGNWWCACGKCRQMPTEVEIFHSTGPLSAFLFAFDTADASPSPSG